MVWHSGVKYDVPTSKHVALWHVSVEADLANRLAFKAKGEWDWYPSDPYQCDYLHLLDWFGSFSKVQETDFESWFDVNSLCSATCLCTPQRFIAIAQHVVKWCEMYCIFFVTGRQGSRCKSPRTSLAERVQGQTCLRRVGYQVTTLDDSGRSQSHHICWYLVVT